MGRRGYDRRRKCGADGCREWSIVNYEYKRDYADAVRREKGKPWLCIRHSKPDEVLSIDNPEITYSVASEESFSTYSGNSVGLFWDRQGFVHGPGFKAWAKDFPPGTRLVINARIVLPDGYVPPPPTPKPPTYHVDRVDLDQ